MSTGRVAIVDLELSLIPLQRDPLEDGCGAEPFEAVCTTTGRADVFADGMVHRVEVKIGDAELWVPVSALSSRGEPYDPGVTEMVRTMPLGALQREAAEVDG